MVGPTHMCSSRAVGAEEVSVCQVGCARPNLHLQNYSNQTSFLFISQKLKRFLTFSQLTDHNKFFTAHNPIKHTQVINEH
jgi:hypothetical protein